MTAPADLSDLIRRLEAATVKIESFAFSSNVSTSLSGKPTLGNPSPPPTGATVPSSLELTPVAQAFFDTIIDDVLVEYVKLSATLGDQVKEQSNFINTAFHQTLQLIQLASTAKKPNDWPTGSLPQQFITPIRQAIENAVSLRDKNRTSKQFTHITAVADGVPALGWIVIDPKPAPYISELKDASQFYINRVVKEFKDKPDGTQHVAWTHAWTKLLTTLLNYVKQWHTTGLIWNLKPNAVEFTSVAATATTAISLVPAISASGIGVPPPPPPGPPPTLLSSVPTSNNNNDNNDDNARHALFSQLNVGSAITSSLKKVDPSQMTHKNPALRATTTTAHTSTSATSSVTKSSVSTNVTTTNSTPKQGSMTLQGQKWVIENYIGKRDIILTDTSIKTVVYVYGCTDCAIQVQGKVNSVTIDNCKKSGVMVDSAVSTVDIVNGKSIQLQVNGSVPTIAVDNSDGITLYLSEEALSTELLTSKASELNVMLPPITSGGDYRECPVPEQFKTTMDKDKGILITVPVEHKG